MTRRHFITGISAVGFIVATFALAMPAALLGSKGVAAAAPTVVWLRELGILIFAMSVLLAAVRAEPGSPALRAICIANVAVHLGLFPIEVAAYLNGTLTELSGIVPNSIFHVLAAGGFAWFAARMQPGK
jgi:hypothetical protein